MKAPPVGSKQKPLRTVLTLEKKLEVLKELDKGFLSD